MLQRCRVLPVLLIAVVCHPHSLHGGTLTNKVAHMITKAFVELGAETLRFNFRGVGDHPACLITTLVKPVTCRLRWTRCVSAIQRLPYGWLLFWCL